MITIHRYKEDRVYEWQLSWTKGDKPIRSGFTRTYLAAWFKVNRESFIRREQFLAMRRTKRPKTIYNKG